MVVPSVSALPGAPVERRVGRMQPRCGDGVIVETGKNRLRIPEGCALIPISENHQDAALKVCVLVTVQADPGGQGPILLRSTLDARIYLGGLVDAGGQVQAWLELWVQDAGALGNTSLARRVFLTNALLDDRWHKHVQAFDQLGAAETVTLGWETTPALPTFLDMAALSPVHPKDEATGAYWRLCRDEAILQQHGVPSYAGSLHRYLYLPEQDAETPLVPVTDEAPTNDHTRPLAEICPNHAVLVPLNPAAGFLLVTRHYPMDLEDFLDLLGGTPQRPERGRSPLAAVADQDSGRDDDWAVRYPGRLFLDTQGKYRRLLEVLHLKLVLLSNVVAAVHAVVRGSQQPFLNLSPESFHVEVDRDAGPLPFLWTARPRLVEPGHALAVHEGAAGLTYFVSPLIGETSIYRPAVTSLPLCGRALVRIRKTPSDSQTTAVVEGTLATQERLDLGANDLVVVQLPLASGELCLHAHLKQESALAGDEYRFRTLSRSLDTEQIRALRSAQGVPLSDVPFEVLRLLSSPCDLYSLAILAIRTLLVGRDTSLPVAVDELLSLARQVQTGDDPAQPLPLRVERVFLSDPRWLPALGPHRLTEEEITPQEALDLVPRDVWWSTLALMVRMFPGLGPASLCQDYGDARTGGLHVVFEQTRNDLVELVLKTRYLVTPDLKADRQIAALIRRYLENQTVPDTETTKNRKHRKGMEQKS